MQNFTINLTGDKPLLMHNVRLADPMDTFTRMLKSVSSKRIKTDEDFIEMSKIEFMGGLYIDDKLGPFMPSTWFHKSLTEGARLTRRGKDVERAVFVDDDAPLIYKGPREAEAMWVDGNFRHVAIVKIGQAKVARTRPIFRDWSCEFEVMVDTELLNVEDFLAICESSGRYIGVGDWRPRFGRFSVDIQTGSQIPVAALPSAEVKSSLPWVKTK